MCYIDLHATLGEWTYDADQISVRKIVGMDGAVRIQMRVELGVLQMEVTGRPDAFRPFGYESLLGYHLNHLRDGEDPNETALGYVLTPKTCQALREEASLFYRRYVAFFVLEEYSQVVSDTTHNLAIFDLCRDYAMEQTDRDCLESFRPYVLMMKARAQALEAMAQSEYASALAHVNRGLMELTAHFEGCGKPEAAESSEEVKMLRGVGAEVARQIPLDSLVVTRRALRAAIEQERFEEAARLRDELKTRFDVRR